MPHECISLPPLQPIQVDLFYLERYIPAGHHQHNLEFLQKIRHPGFVAHYPDWQSSTEALRYYHSLPHALTEFHQLVREVPAEIVLCPPSHRSDAIPYLAAAKLYRLECLDLTRFFSKTAPVRAGQIDRPEALADVLRFTYSGDLARYSSLLLVDDVFSSGTTTAAIVSILRAHGFPHDAAVSVAVPLRI